MRMYSPNGSNRGKWAGMPSAAGVREAVRGTWASLKFLLFLPERRNTFGKSLAAGRGNGVRLPIRISPESLAASRKSGRETGRSGGNVLDMLESRTGSRLRIHVRWSARASEIGSRILDRVRGSREVLEWVRRVRESRRSSHAWGKKWHQTADSENGAGSRRFSRDGRRIEGNGRISTGHAVFPNRFAGSQECSPEHARFWN